VDWLNANSGAVQATTSVFVAALTAVLAVATLVYVRLTHQIARASIEQGEAQQKPCLILRTTRRDDQWVILDPPLAAEVEGGNLRILNIGSGPALQVQYDFCRMVDNRQVSSTGLIPHLTKDGNWDTPIAMGLLANNTSLVITCTGV
jgi:hypothetical protein